VKFNWRQVPNFAKNAGSLSVGAIIASGLQFLASPILTRLYTPDEFGIYNALFGFSTILALFSSFSLQMAIPLAKTDSDASDLIWLTLFNAFAIALPLGALSSLFLSDLMRTDVSTALWLTAVVTAGISMFWLALRALASRHHLFHVVSASGVVDSGSQSAGQLVLGFASLGTVGLAIGYLFGKVVAVGVLLAKDKKHLKKPQRMKKVAQNWSRQGSWLTPTTLLNQGSITAIGPLIVAFFGSATAGNFSLAMRILAVPSAFIGQAVADVFFSRAARIERTGDQTSLAVDRVASALFAVGLPVFSITTLMGPEIFVLLFGSEWRDAGLIASLLSPWLGLNLISSPISGVIAVKRQSRRLLIAGFGEAFFRTLALIVGYSQGNWLVAVGGYSLIGIASSLVAIAWSINLAGGSSANWCRTILNRNGIEVLMVLGAVLLRHVVPLQIYLLGSAALIAVLLFRNGRILLGLLDTTRNPQK
jgi:lipopolysaccharide exporter